MSRIVTSFDPSAATQGSFTANILVNDSSLLILNESSYFLKLDLGTSGGQIIIQPWVNRLIRHVDRLQDVYWFQAGSISPINAPISICYVIAFDPGEEVSDAWNMPLQRITNVGNALSISGSPTIVSTAIRQHVIATTVQTILSYTPPAVGVFRISGHVRRSDVSAAALLAEVQWSDPDISGSPFAYFAMAGTGFTAHNATLLDGSTSISAADSMIALLPITLVSTANTAITLSYQNPVATPNDFVTFIIEKLA